MIKKTIFLCKTNLAHMGSVKKCMSVNGRL